MLVTSGAVDVIAYQELGSGQGSNLKVLANSLGIL